MLDAVLIGLGVVLLAIAALGGAAGLLLRVLRGPQRRR